VADIQKEDDRKTGGQVDRESLKAENAGSSFPVLLSSCHPVIL
jgi:hypothetical protein